MSQKYPKISIITPNFNGAAFLEETIQSVLGQNYPNLEYIIIDGGSTDCSLEIIKKYEAQLTFWISEPDKGQADAINKGLQRATGDWIAFLNSDDLYLNHTLSTIAETALLQPNAHWIVGSTEIFGENDTSYKIRHAKANYKTKPIDWITYKADSPQPSSFWSRKAMEKGGLLSPDFHFAFDCEFWLRLNLAGFFPKKVNRTLARFRFYKGSKTAKGRLPFLDEHRKMLVKFQAQFTPKEIKSAHKLLNKLEAEYRTAHALETETPFSELMKAVSLYPGVLKKRMFLGAIKRIRLHGNH